MSTIFWRSKTERAVKAFGAMLGESRVFVGAVAETHYTDPFSLEKGSRKVVAAVAPETTAEVQEVVRIANRLAVPLWPVSRGKNLGYGAAAPLLEGSVVVDLSCMNRILSVDEKSGYCVVEPGVGFIDLFDFLRSRRLPLWMSIPGNPEGSVLGNALERGIGYTPYGDHAAQLCGLEVVLPDGELLRTGMGAMRNPLCWHRYAPGFGPSYDAMFVQSNFGIVTQAGVWLMPEPEATLQARLRLPAEQDLARAVDTLARLRLENVVQHPVGLGNWLHEAATLTRRADWYAEDGPIPAEVAGAMRDRYQLGWWNATIRLFGYREAIEAHAKIVRNAFSGEPGAELVFSAWQQGEPLERSAAPLPNPVGLQIANWHGGQGSHLNLPIILPPDGALAYKHATRMRHRFEESGFDYQTSFTVGQRYVNSISSVVFDRGKPKMAADAKDLVRAAIADAAREGLGAYRAHLEVMEMVADTYDYNDHALRRFSQRIKDAIDPMGILAPGKNGIWPT